MAVSRADVLPAWVADMDFPVASRSRATWPSALAIDDLGYPLDRTPGALPTVFAKRMLERFGWQVDPHRVLVLTDVVQGIYVALDRSEPGDGVVVQTPVYPPFLTRSARLGRRWS